MEYIVLSGNVDGGDFVGTDWLTNILWYAFSIFQLKLLFAII